MTFDAGESGRVGILMCCWWGIGRGVGVGLLPPVWKSHQAFSMNMKNSYFSLNSTVLLWGMQPMKRTYVGTQVLVTALLVDI